MDRTRIRRSHRPVGGNRNRRMRHESLEDRRLLAGDGADGIIAPPDVGDTLQTAAELEFDDAGGREVAEMIGNNKFGPADVDMFRIELEQGDAIVGYTTQIAFLGLDDAADDGIEPPFRFNPFALRVFDVEGNQVAASHNTPRPALGPILPDSLLEFVAETDGVFFVGVSGLLNTAYDPEIAGSGEGIHVGGYLLTLHRDPVDPDVGDTIPTALGLKLESNSRTRVGAFLGNNEFQASDVDMFQVPLRDGETLELVLEPANSGVAVVDPALAAVIRVFNRAGEEVAISPVPEDGIGGRVSVAYTASTGGVFFVGISSVPNIEYDPFIAGSGEGKSSGRYVLEVARHRVEPSDDFGDTLRDAEPLRLAPSTSVRFEEILGNNEFGPNDVDLVRIELSRGDVLAGHLSSIVPIPADIALGGGVLRVFDAAGNELAIGFSAPGDVLPLPPADPVFLAASVELVIPRDGVYYVGISSFPNLGYDPREPNSGIGLHFGHYVVQLERGAIEPGIDVGDTLSDAMPIEVSLNSGAKVEELIGNNRFGPNDVDLYQVRLREGDILASHVETPGIPGEADRLAAVLRAFDSAGTELASAVIVGAAGDVTTTGSVRIVAPEDGLYYVGVSSFPNLAYDPNAADSGVGASTGLYMVGFELGRVPPRNDVGDTLATSLFLPLRPNLHSHVDERLGNNRYGSSDVDIFQVQLATGDALLLHLSAELEAVAGVDPISPQAAIRVFSADGIELAVAGGELLRPGIRNSELLLDFLAPVAGRYFVGVSSAPNLHYDPLVAGSGLGIGVGSYEVLIHLEPNNLPADIGDTLASAAPIVVSPDEPVSVTEFLGNNRFGAADVDMFAVELRRGDSLDTTLSHPNLDVAGFPGLSSGVLRAFDAAGNQLEISPGTDAADFSNVKIRLEAPQDGMYFVGVSSEPNREYDPQVPGSGAGAQVGHFVLDVRVERPIAVEVGDTLATAEFLELDPEHRLHVDEVIGNNEHGPADVDLYRFELVTGDELRVNLVGSWLPNIGPDEARLRGVLRVFDAEGNPLATSVTPVLDNRLRHVVSVEFVAPATGEYFVGVSSFPNDQYDPRTPGSGTGSSVGHYFLSLDLDRQVRTDDVGDTLRTATPIELTPGARARVQEFIGNNRFGPSDVDLYRMELVAGDILRVVLRDPIPEFVGLEGVLRIFDSAGTQLAANIDRIGVVGIVLEFEVPADGLYFVGVSSAPNRSYDPLVAGSGDGGTVGPYQLEFGVGRAADNPDPVAEERGPRNRPRLRVPRFWAAALRRTAIAEAAEVEELLNLLAKDTARR